MEDTLKRRFTSNDVQKSYYQLLENILNDQSKIAEVSGTDEDKINSFRDAYARGVVEQNDPGHEAYKKEVDILIKTIAQEQELFAFLDFTVNPPQQTTAPSQGIQPLDSCSELQAYGHSTAEPPIKRNVVLDLRYFMDKAFEGDLAKTVLGLVPDPSLSGERAGLNALKPLLLFAVVDPHFGATGPAFLFKR
jgi:hypothetical protein